MALEFEQLTEQVEKMAVNARARDEMRWERLTAVADTLRTYNESWTELEERIEEAIALTLKSPQPRPYSAARPFDHDAPLDTAVSPPPLPAQATLIAVDGSQIVPDRHAPFVYNLVNIGGIVYFHGRETAPDTFAIPQLTFPPADQLSDRNFQDGDSVTLARDTFEMETLAQKVATYRAGPSAHEPILAIMDQRLLYVPATTESDRAAKNQAIEAWQKGMKRIHDQQSWLVGYIDRPAKSSVIAMLYALQQPKPSDPSKLGEWEGLMDRELFAQILGPGQRSKLFVDVSFANEKFKEFSKQQEICFFYLNPGQVGQDIARVDVPRWVAEDNTAVDTIHALLLSQCQLLGSYPYIIARADEMAVVTQQDRERLELLIGKKLVEQGLSPTESNKQLMKYFARSQKRRF